jgi:phage/plasmid-like protein (TIGR03299 family)
MLFSKSDDLKWSVRKESIRTESGILVENKQAIVREDTNQVLSVMGKDYQPYQNAEMHELLSKVSNQMSLNIERSGSFGNGEKVYTQLKSGSLSLNGDRVEGFLTGINSFDGSTSLAFGPTNLTISCTNSFFAAFKQMNSKVRHTKNMGIKVDEICFGLQNVLKEEEKIFADIKRLSETRFDEAIKERVIHDLFNIDKAVNLKKDWDKLASVTRNKLSKFYVDLNGEINQKGDNMWGLFSGVTKYTTHSYSKGDNTETKMFGGVGNREREIFTKLVELV